MFTPRSARAGVLAAFALAASAPTAAAEDVLPGATGETVTVIETAKTVDTCVDPVLSNPLVAFKDSRDYFIAPGGDFESQAGAGWTLEGGARIAEDGGGVSLGMGADQRALVLPPGASATSPAFCVDLHFPTFRFLASQAGAEDTELKVDVIYPALERDNVREAKKLRPKEVWELSKDVKLEPQRLGKRAGWRKIAIRFRADDDRAGAVKIDDVLIDPRMRA